MKLTVVGTGYVGLVSGVCFSEIGNNVICIDRDADKIDRLKNGEVPIYEPGLQEYLVNNMNNGRLEFSTDIKYGVKESDLIIIAVGTPSLPNGEANLAFVEEVARNIAVEMNGYKVIMTKSTVPVGTNERIKEIICSITDHPFDVVSVPEFLREGSAVKDTFSPDRVVIGVENKRAEEIVSELHKPLTDKVVVTDIRSAEMIKYASNAFLATKISFINEIANICDKVGADVSNVAKGMGYDKRIGPHFLNAGIGYGGSCFPKDTDALIQIAGNADYDFKLLKAVVDVNKHQRYNILDKLQQVLGNLNGKKIAIWGLAFKPNTDDVRDAPANEVITELLKLGADVSAYDPIAMDNFKKSLDQDGVSWSETAFEAVQNADAVCLLTEWDEFKEADLNQLEAAMRFPVLIDGRNVFTQEQLSESNLIYHSVGRPRLQQKELELYV
ncbi:UDP-glucose dehydrogenase family protein [Pseudalkalibacillus caeni]|uniref:UDP-glucose 6-dehydrogenase n=1 Tax=Exobacillus caeni TaxID=2574798 RepID=A0A5R9EXB1_9BACL|nr:UDP-glucose/GDP-mannose dehydrogenase family protein [Pseudalkalibacillus caeni]TLS35179.1 UDP-glucose/GDP-mannose dehydrogenase family protein [Pseudalkalibacillus caeni]